MAQYTTISQSLKWQKECKLKNVNNTRQLTDNLEENKEGLKAYIKELMSIDPYIKMKNKYKIVYE